MQFTSKLSATLATRFLIVWECDTRDDTRLHEVRDAFFASGPSLPSESDDHFIGCLERGT